MQVVGVECSEWVTGAGIRVGFRVKGLGQSGPGAPTIEGLEVGDESFDQRAVEFRGVLRPCLHAHVRARAL